MLLRGLMISDEFPAITLNICSQALAKPIQILYNNNYSLATDQITSELKLAKVTPIYKGGSISYYIQ